jgi:hypothetical protein
VYCYKAIDNVIVNIDSLERLEYIRQFYTPKAYANPPGMKELSLGAAEY